VIRGDAKDLHASLNRNTVVIADGETVRGGARATRTVASCSRVGASELLPAAAAGNLCTSGTPKGLQCANDLGVLGCNLGCDVRAVEAVTCTP
jgi:hypothetical protein